MDEIKFWRFIESNISKGNKIVLLIVADATNASPGRTGFKMAISSNNTTFGTIGGGIMEYNIIEEVNESFSNGYEFNTIRKLHHNTSATGNKSGLMCGGVQTMLLKSIGKSNLDIINSILNSLDNESGGLLSISHELFEFSIQKKNYNDLTFSIENDSSWLYEENIGNPNTAYIVGGGHVGLAVSRIMRTINFRVVVFDNRSGIQTIKENKYADKIINTDFNNINQYIKEGSKSYVIVVTPNHDGDKDALQAILKLDLKYIGSMGSAKKISSIFNQLKRDGFTERELKRIHTPIGLEIEAETPEEIAISIAAEIIHVKNS